MTEALAILFATTSIRVLSAIKPEALILNAPSEVSNPYMAPRLFVFRT